jgi:excisionase family DNA binding protein
VPCVTPRQRNIEAEPLLTPGEVADLFKVNPLTVTRWAHQGRIGSIRTLGGHNRYKEGEVLRLLYETTQEADQET